MDDQPKNTNKMMKVETNKEYEMSLDNAQRRIKIERKQFANGVTPVTATSV